MNKFTFACTNCDYTGDHVAHTQFCPVCRNRMTKGVSDRQFIVQLIGESKLRTLQEAGFTITREIEL
jgi:Zn finger protein HypA/HybF involved in hydrogenase expression